MTSLADTAERIVAAAVDCLLRLGWEKTTISAVAAQAGVSRPTVYAHFATREDLYAVVAANAGETITRRAVETAQAATSGAEFVVELVTAWVAEFRADPPESMIGLLRPGHALSSAAITLARSYLAPLVNLEPGLEPELDEIAETITRFLISLLVFDSDNSRTDDALRGYLRRRLLPSIGL